MARPINDGKKGTRIRNRWGIEIDDRQLTATKPSGRLFQADFSRQKKRLRRECRDGGRRDSAFDRRVREEVNRTQSANICALHKRRR